MASLTALDIVVLLLILLGGVAGLARGFVTEVLSLLAWVAAIMAVRLLYPTGVLVARRLVSSDSAAAILAFAVIFLTTFIAFRMIATMLGSRTRASVVGPVDRLLGLGFGAFKGLLFAALLYLALQFAFDTMEADAPRPAWLVASRTAPLLAVTSKAMVDFVDKRRHPDAPPVKPAGKADLPPGHPRIPGHGYSHDDRSALDRLLDAGTKTPL